MTDKLQDAIQRKFEKPSLRKRFVAGIRNFFDRRFGPIWHCRRCGVYFNRPDGCNCTTSPSPWEPVK